MQKGEFPLAIRITKDRKSSFIFTGQYIDEQYWDVKQARIKKSHPNSARLNNLLIQKLAEANNKLLELDTGKTYSSATISLKPQLVYYGYDNRSTSRSKKLSSLCNP